MSGNQSCCCCGRTDRRYVMYGHFLAHLVNHDKYFLCFKDQITLEGLVVQRAECKPAVQESYMKLKRLQIEESTKPLRLSQQLEKAVTTNYKPVSNHNYNVEYEKKKKEEGKRARADKQKVLEMLFSAFEKHQYYNIKDLVEITKQPVIYLKEILREIGVYNSRGPHKSTWELKPEYSHYQEVYKNAFASHYSKAEVSNGKEVAPTVPPRRDVTACESTQGCQILGLKPTEALM
ncbi:hypothetical protein P4O66_014852 [Electrophorus voltai]|uniref:General transcription factor IIF subunit 2 n=1 Tax=Electrophorus voltai TaxID=2609070 RepID=A0AAD8YZP2_9TELE|nr:hypothetical protein P4O66_014852 [Electrophorus voltai]